MAIMRTSGPYNQIIWTISMTIHDFIQFNVFRVITKHYNMSFFNLSLTIEAKYRPIILKTYETYILLSKYSLHKVNLATSV